MFKLSRLGELRSGFQLRGAAKHTEDGVHTVIQLGDARDTGIDMSRLIRMNLDRARERDFVSSGDILLRARGASYRACLVNDCLPQTVATAPLFVFRLNRRDALPPYLVWYINRPEVQGILAGFAHGSYIPTVSIEVFAELDIFLPPLDVQRQIVEVDALTQQEKALSARLAEERERLAQALLERLLISYKQRGDDHEG